jgi:uncharacterized protein (TIGR03083 family)
MSQRPPANTLTSRAAFFTREAADWERLQQLLDGLEPESLTRPGACGVDWSVKDVLNHFAAWQEAALRVVGDLRAGRWGRLGPSVERFNREQHAADRDRPLDETLQRLQSARAALLQLLTQVDETTLLNEYGRQAVGWWAKWTTYGHYEQHLNDLEEFARAARG